MRRWGYITMLAAAMFTVATAQAQQVQLNRGNQLYQGGQYPQAASAYQKALQLNPLYTPGLFNLGNALYQQKQYDSARKFLSAAAKNEPTPQLRSAANYNIGNTYMREQKWQEAIDAYKQTLRENPQDMDAKYNLSYAQQMKQREEEEKKKKKQQQPDKNKGNEAPPPKPEDDKNNNNNQNQNQPNKPGEEEGPQQQRPQPMPSKLTEQQAGQLLNALQQEEKKLQDKLQKGKGAPTSTGRDW